MNMQFNTLSRLKPALAGLLLSLISTGHLAMADDTEIFFGSQTAVSTSFPNVMFVLDTSGSMNSTDGTGISRLNRMKSAVKEILENTTNLNVGLMRYNGSSGGGAVLYPVTYIDKELCPNGVCTDGSTSGDITLNYRVEQSEDDAEENPSSGSVDTSGNTLSLVQITGGTVTTTKSYYTGSDNDDAEQYRSGNWFYQYSGDIDMFYDNGWRRKEQLVGWRFRNVDIPRGGNISSATVTLSAFNSSQNKGLVGAEIWGHDTNNANSFSNQGGRRLKDRSATTARVDWPSIPLPSSAQNYKLTSPDISSIVSEITSRSGWNSGNSLVVIMRNDNSVSSSNQNRSRQIRSHENGNSTRAKLDVSFEETGVINQKVGLRFNDVKIPQGATVTSAKLIFRPTSTNSSSTNLTIRAQDTDNATAFSNSGFNISSRTTTSASASWSPSSWSSTSTDYESSDIKNVVQEVVNRSGWCGGNSLALILEGTGLRQAISYDNDPNYAPQLRLEYDPASIPSSGGCNGSESISSVATGSDDVEQRTSGGTMSFDSTDLEFIKDGGNQQIVGIRFRNVAVPKDAIINTATLTFTVDETQTGSASVRIYGENNATPSLFSQSSYNLSNRSWTSQSVDWNNIDAETVGNSLISPNLKTIVGQITGLSNWQSGNDMVFFIEKKSGNGRRTVESYNGDPVRAPRLKISYTAQSSSGGSGSTVTFQSTRDKMSLLLDDMLATGGTPTVDAFYEAARYFRGEGADYGKKRGYYTNGYHRISHEESYTGGSVSRPSSCSVSNYNSRNCRSEKINGSPIYKSPMNDVCQTNHIVMLTDGQPTSNSSSGKIKSMIGSNSCTSRERGAGTCAEELVSWLKTNDQSSSVPGMQDITTYTIGFNFSGDWIRDVAVAGGGSFYEASSSADLVTAFKNILAEILKVDTSFVAPAATVNQFNRLTHSDKIYFSLFKPSEKPKWAGNVKKYKIAGSPAVVVDATGAAAIDTNSGYFKDTARSFWSDATDGSSVEKGGAAAELALSGRKVYTYTGSNTKLSHSSNSLHENNGNISKSMLDIDGQTDAYRTTLLRWARGMDVEDLDGDGSYTDIRQQLGDPMHSSPTVVDYSATKSVIYFGTNEGFLHAVDTSNGKEVFSFIPEELLPNLDSFYVNRSSIDHPYGLDGPITVWQDEANGKVYLVAGMRRGGNNYYMLDITSYSNPKLKWIIKGGSSSGFGELSQSWSKPIHTKIKVGGSEKQVLIFAAGYDTAQDSITKTQADSVGRGIFIVDALTGNKLWDAGPIGSGATETFSDMQYSMPSDVKVVDIDYDGLADQMYIGDMGGQVWRFDIDNTAGSYTQLIDGGVVADLGDNDIEGARRFYYAPDVAVVSDNGKSYLSIAVGSGYRAHPLNLDIDDRFYVLRSNAVYAAPQGYGKETSGGGYRPVTENDLKDITNDLSPSSGLGDGWYLRMEGTGEKVLAESTTINHQVVFTTYEPEQTSTACSSALGGGSVYVLDINTGAPTTDLNDSGGDDLSKDDRSKELKHGGIPPKATALFPDKENPILLIGPEQPIDDFEFGDLTRTTFWQIQTDTGQ